MTEPDLPTAPESIPGPAAGTQPEPAATRKPLTKTQKQLLGTAAAAALLIAIIGFAGSYSAVSNLATQKHFGWFAHAFPIGIDAGIVAFLALDLVLTWLRIPYPLLRQGAWGMTAATIAFNAATAWGDNLAVGMHAAIPVLFVIVVEAARHAIGRIANIVADRHIESPPLIRWILSPIGTYLIWRRMRVWQIPSYLLVIELLRELRVFRAKLRRKYGWLWRWKADANELLVFEMARFGISVSEALAMPEVEAEAQRKAEAAQRSEARQQAEAEAEALRVQEQQRQTETEARRIAAAEAETKLAELEAKRRLADAEAEAELAKVKQRRLTAEAEAEAERRQIAEETREAEAAAELRRRCEADEQAKRAGEAETTRLREAEEAIRRTSEAEAKALEAAQQRLRVQELALRNAREEARMAAEAEARARPNPKPETAQPQAKPKLEVETAKPKQPAELGGRRVRIEAEVEALIGLMQTKGYDEVDLDLAISELNLKQTTAWDRLNRARQEWSKRNAA